MAKAKKQRQKTIGWDEVLARSSRTLLAGRIQYSILSTLLESFSRYSKEHPSSDMEYLLETTAAARDEAKAFADICLHTHIGATHVAEGDAEFWDGPITKEIRFADYERMLAREKIHS